jgi:pilus assembly protein CpaB
VALEDVELLALGPAAGEAAAGAGPEAGADGARAAASAMATLRVRPLEAVYLAAAQNYARELRLLVRPPGDRRRTGRQVVSAAGL